MDICSKLKNGYSITCEYNIVNIAQRIVLINKDDVDSYIYMPNNNLRFQLKEGATGYPFEYMKYVSAINADFRKSELRSRPTYSHKIDIHLNGVDDETMKILYQLDNSIYFGAVLYSDNTVKIFGFNYGLKTDSYNYDTNSDIRLQSRENERNMPYIYNSVGNEVEDFENNFVNVPDIALGDFNNDFNNDFYNGL